MLRILVFLALLLGLALGVVWVLDRPGEVVITWLGQRIEFDILTAMIGTVLLAVLMGIAWTLLRTLLRLPRIMTLMGRTRRRTKGYEAVTEGLIALGNGDARVAGRRAADARRLLGDQPVALLLAAQSAQLAGDGAKASEHFRSMLEQGSTRLLGLRGLHMEAARSGDERAARFYAEEAYRFAPGAGWAAQAALSYRCSDRDWAGAVALVEQNASRRLIDRDEARRQRAALLAAEALERLDSDPDGALRSALEAHQLDPGLVPAAVIAGRRKAERGDYGRASKILEAAWQAQPHPELAEAYLNVRQGDSTLDRLKRAKLLQRLAPRDPESRLVVARAAIEAREWGLARENLETLLRESPTARGCALMALLEERESGNLGLAREWLARAARAPRDKAWVADGVVCDQWVPASPVTGRIGACLWQTPPQALPPAPLLEALAAPPEPEVTETAPAALPPQDALAIPAPAVAEPTRAAADDVKPAVTAEAPAAGPAVGSAPNGADAGGWLQREKAAAAPSPFAFAPEPPPPPPAPEPVEAATTDAKGEGWWQRKPV